MKTVILTWLLLSYKESESIVDEMNSLGTSRSDNIRYDELKKIREDLYLQCVQS